MTPPANIHWLTRTMCQAECIKCDKKAVRAYHRAAQRPLTMQQELLHQAVRRTLLAALRPHIFAGVFSCQLPQNVLQGCCGRRLLSLNNCLCFNISAALEGITGRTRFNIHIWQLHILLLISSIELFSNESTPDRLFPLPVDILSGNVVRSRSGVSHAGLRANRATAAGLLSASPPESVSALSQI